MPHERLRPHSAFTEERLAELKAIVPEAFGDGNINWGVLRELLDDSLEEQGMEAEHFGLTWPGKRAARRLAAMPSRGTLVPVPNEGVNEATTRNLFIEGDNLEVLKLLQKAYVGYVKMIYIDPPYNTGNDFIYRDTFADSLEDYLRLTRQSDDNGALTTNTRADGRFHSKWLSMMYSRIRLARQLLRDDGFLVVSIDDTELASLRLLLNELMGEENWLATLVWDRNRKNDARFFSVGHEYMLVYALSKDFLIAHDVVLRAQKEGVEDIRAKWEQWRHDYNDDWTTIRAQLKAYFKSLPDDDPRKPLSRFGKVDEKGPYRDDGNASWPGGGGPRYEVLHPTTGRPCKVPSRGWVFAKKDKMLEMIDAGVVVFGPDESFVPKIRTNLFEKTDQVMRSVHFSYAQTASQQFDALFDGTRIFDNAKPYQDLSRLVEYLTDAGDMVLDFFAGSASMGHAVIDVSLRTGEERQFVLVQLPEPVNKKELSGHNAAQLNLATIADVGKERLRRVIRKLQGELAAADMEPGFRVFRLRQSFFKAWEDYVGSSDEELQSLFAQTEDPLIGPWTPDELLAEVMLMEGFPLDSHVEQIGGREAADLRLVISDRCGHRLLACFDGTIQDAMLEGIDLTAEDVFVCFDGGLNDEQRLRLADRCTLRTI